jgi:hypothetical protein
MKCSMLLIGTSQKNGSTKYRKTWHGTLHDWGTRMAKKKTTLLDLAREYKPPVVPKSFIAKLPPEQAAELIEFKEAYKRKEFVGVPLKSLFFNVIQPNLNLPITPCTFSRWING